MTLSSDEPTQWKHEYDQRQYRRMIERLESFEAGHLDLGGLVGDLGTLLTALEEKPANGWADEFAELHFELELVNEDRFGAGSSFRSALTHKEMRRARDIVASLKRLVLPKVEPWSGP